MRTSGQQHSPCAVGRQRILERVQAPILDVVSYAWCTGCTTCVGLCPAQALAVGETPDGRCVPEVLSDRCTGCGLCLEVCSPAGEGLHSLHASVFGEAPADPIMGPVHACYLGYAKDADLRWHATSGGLITTLLLYLLRERRIDGALVTRMSADDPLRPDPFIARTEAEVLSAMGSKYVPVPLNQRLRQVLHDEGRYAIVGLPCHLHGLRLAQKKVPVLRERIAYHFGLVCSRTMGRGGWELVLDRMGVSPEQVAGLKFRGEGWPGGLTVTLKDGARRSLPMFKSSFSEVFGGSYFSHHHCMVCEDVWAEVADISFADAYVPRVMQIDKKGTSLAVSRTAAGDGLLAETADKGLIHLEPISRSDALRSQLFMTLFKKRNIAVRLGWLRLLGKEVPPALRSREGFLRPTVFDYVAAPIPFINIRISRSRIGSWLLRRLPLKVLALSRKLHKWLLVRRSKEYLES